MTLSKKSTALPKQIRDKVEEAIKAKSRAKELEAEAKHLNERAKETLLPIMAAYGIQAYAMNGVGTARMKVSNGSSISGPKLREALLIEGISPTKIDSIVSRASNTWSTEYVEFKGEK